MANADEEALQQALGRTRRSGLILRDLAPLTGGVTGRCWTAWLSPALRVVLKIQAGVDDFPAVAESVQAVRLLPPGMLPLPRTLDYGPLPGYGWYAVVEMLPGRRAEFLTPARLDQILSLNRRQVGQRPSRGVDWSARVCDAVDPNGGAWTRLAAASSHGRGLRDVVFANPLEPVDLPTEDLVLGDLNLRNVLFNEGGDGVSGLVDVETTLGFGCRSMDLAPLLVDWHRAQVRVHVDPSEVPDPAVAELLGSEINSIGGHALLACVVTHRLAEGANWAVDHGLEQQLAFWCAAAREILWSHTDSGESRVIGARHSEPGPVLTVGEAWGPR